MILAELLKDWSCEVYGGSIRTEVNGVTDYSKDVQPGYLFVARQGGKEDGFRFINEAVERGAVAIVHDRPCELEGLDNSIPVVWVPNCLTFLSFACAQLEGNPSNLMTVIAVTGTNGKTTVTHFIGQLLRELQHSVAVLGTLGLYINGEKQEQIISTMTTPSPTVLHRILHECYKKGVTHIVLEASSLGLSQHRLDHCSIDVGVFLNLSRDHYEEHGGEVAYKMAKSKLSTLAKNVVWNYDDSFCKTIGQQTLKPSLSFSLQQKGKLNIDIVTCNKLDTSIILRSEKKIIFEKIPIVGEYNIQNVGAAIATLELLGYTLEEVARKLHSLSLPEGRMHEIAHSTNFRVFVDYAHTAAALEAVLRALRSLKKRRLIIVFGCGGERDRGKRKMMGKVANQYADVVFITSDNPRGESVEEIAQHIIEGFQYKKRYFTEHDRGEAIRQALALAEAEDIVLIAGKGHEKTQSFHNRTVPFSDIEFVEQCLKEMNC